MTIQELKLKIENETLDDSGLVFYYTDNRFLVDQYVYAISKLKNRPVVYYDSMPVADSVFGAVDDGALSVVITDTPTLPENNTIVVSKNKCDDSIEFPSLEFWQIKDYVFTLCSGAESDVLESFISKYNDLYKLENEIEKLTIFESSERKLLSKKFLNDNIFNGLSTVNLFDFVNAIQNKNCTSVGNMYNSIEKDTMSFTGIMLKQFRNMVNVYLQDNPTETTTGLKEKQIWAIKRVCKNYTKQQILDRFKFLSTIDLKLKSGELPADIIFDYVLIKLFLL